MRRPERIRGADPAPAASWAALVCAFVALVALVAPVAAARAVSAQAPQDEDFEARSFSIPNARMTQAAKDTATGFVEQGKWVAAIEELQELIDNHRGKVLDGERHDRMGRTSNELVHTGASMWATEMLFAHARELGPAYRERFEGEAREVLLAALGSTDRGALIEVARQWPLTEAAVEAWWTLGDLELERGSVADAIAAWRRGERWSERVLDEAPSGAQQRSALAAEWQRSAGALEQISSNRAPAAFFELPGPGQGAGDLPRYDAHSWSASLDRDRERDYLMNAQAAHVFFPIFSVDTLYLSTGLELFAFDAFSGERRWRSGEAAGWDALPRSSPSDSVLARDKFFGAVDGESLMLAPAVADGVVVCALQIPVTHASSQVFQGQFQITKLNPDRRLYAFDAATGELLWNHRPPANWNGESGSFADRMSVAGPPIIRGSRIFVPTYRLQGRVDYHAACFDLHTGQLQWSASLISGQRELNMFGRHILEFSAPPLVLAGERVLALTQLGAIAGLDAFTGDILWETFYDQLELPPNMQFQQRKRRRYWENAPPVVCGQVAVATPLDSADMVAVDVETGNLLWARSYDAIVPSSRSTPQFALLGCDESRIYLGGHPLLVGECPGGLASGVAPSLPFLSSRQFMTSAGSVRARAVLGERFVVVPMRDQRIALDRDNVQRGADDLHSAAWKNSEDPGNLLLADGALYVCTGTNLHGFFEWGALESRMAQRYQAEPDDPEIAERYSSLYYHRGSEHWEAGKTDDALRDLTRAREILEQSPAASSATGRTQLRLEQRLFRALRGEARVLTELLDRARALDRLAEARTIAPNKDDLAKLLLQEEAILQTRRGSDWEQLLAELDEQCGHLWMPPSFQPFEDPQPHFGEQRERIGLWTQYRLAEGFAEDRRVGREFEILHEILARYGDVDYRRPRAGLGFAKRSVSDRIAELLEAGHTREHEPFEQRAGELLAAALSDGDETLLEEIVARFPHSRAAYRAGVALLDTAAARGDVGRIVDIVQRSLSGDWIRAESGDDEIALLVRLAAALEESNPRAALGLCKRLAELRPDFVVDLPPYGRTTLGQLGRRQLAPPLSPLTSETSSFSIEGLDYGPSHSGRYALLGSLAVPDSGGGRQSILIARRLERPRLLAFSSSFPGEPQWSFDLVGRLHSRFFEGRYALCEDRVLLATDEEVLAIDARSGEQLWSVADSGVYYEFLAVADGVAVVSRNNGDYTEVLGIEIARGNVLWRRPLLEDYLSQPKVGDGWAVFISVRFGRALVLDLFTGTIAREFNVEEGRPEGKDVQAAWIADGTLILPAFSGRFGSRPHWILAFDLQSGQRTWDVPSQPDRQFEFIASTQQKNYLITLPTDAKLRGSIIELDTRLGGTREVPGVRLALDDMPIGIPRYARVPLLSPLLFVQSSSQSGEYVELRAIRLPYGERWTHTLDVTFDDIYIDAWPQPAVSTDIVTLAYSAASKSRTNQPNLLFLDRHTGKFLDRFLLPSEMGGAGQVELATIGDALILGSSRADLHVLGKYR